MVRLCYFYIAGCVVAACYVLCSGHLRFGDMKVRGGYSSNAGGYRGRSPRIPSPKAMFLTHLQNLVPTFFASASACARQLRLSWSILSRPEWFVRDDVWMLPVHPTPHLDRGGITWVIVLRRPGKRRRWGSFLARRRGYPSPPTSVSTRPAFIFDGTQVYLNGNTLHSTVMEVCSRLRLSPRTVPRLSRGSGSAAPQYDNDDDDDDDVDLFTKTTIRR